MGDGYFLAILNGLFSVQVTVFEVFNTTQKFQSEVQGYQPATGEAFFIVQMSRTGLSREYMQIF